MRLLGKCSDEATKVRTEEKNKRGCGQRIHISGSGAQRAWSVEFDSDVEVDDGTVNAPLVTERRG